MLEKISEEDKKPLLVLTGIDYAKKFKELYGNFPKWVPTISSSDFWSRTWMICPKIKTTKHVAH